MLGQQASSAAQGHESTLALATGRTAPCHRYSASTAACALVVITHKSPTHKYAITRPVAPELN